MPSTLTVAVAQSFCMPGDVEGNVARMEPLIRQAAGGGTRRIRGHTVVTSSVTGIATSISARMARPSFRIRVSVFCLSL